MISFARAAYAAARRVKNMRHRLKRSILIISAILLAPASATQAKHAYTVADMLKLEFIGKAIADPTGRWLIWEQAPPYDQIKDFSLGSYNFGVTGYRLMALDLHARTPTARPLFDTNAAQSVWIDSFSPSGRFIAFYMAENGEYSMGVYDLETGKRTSLGAAPRLDATNSHRSVWISSDEFVLSTLLPGDQPIKGLRRQTGKLLWRDWNAAWRGELSVNEVASHAEEANSTRPLAGRLIKANAKTGQMTVLADGLYDTITMSHDGRYMAALRQYSKVQSKPGVSDLDWTLSRSELLLFDLSKGGAGQVVATGKDVFPSTLSWAADRDRLAFFAWDIGAGVRTGVFNALDADRGTVTPMPHIGLDLVSERERGLFQKPERAVWVGDRLAIFARENPDNDAAPRLTYRPITGKGTNSRPAKADWFLLDARGNHENLTSQFKQIDAIPLSANGTSMAVLADGNLWRVGPGLRPVNLTARTRGHLDLPNDIRFSNDHLPFGRQATLIERGKTASRAIMVDLVDGGVKGVRYPVNSELLASTAGTAAFALLKHTEAAQTYLVLNKNDGKNITVARLNADMANVYQTTYSSVRYPVKNSTGTQSVDGCMILPPGYQKGRRYPVVVYVYPSYSAGCLRPENNDYYAMGGQSGGLDLHLLAARGYIVFHPNTSRAITNRPPNPQGGMADAVDAGIDALVAQGYADPSRIGLFGVSQGGFSALWLATQMSRLKAVVSINGWADMYSHVFDGTVMQRYYADQIPYIGNGMRYEPSTGDFGTGVSVWNDPDVYVRNGALFNARKISAPVMLIHSDMDAFSLNQYDMMFTALYQQRKEARFLRYAGEGHGPSSPANIRHMWTSIFEWFDRYLGADQK